MLRVVLTSFSAIALLGMAGCATLFKGNTDSVSVNSVPRGAIVEIRQIHGLMFDRTDVESMGPPVQAGLTPMSVKLVKGKEYAVTISLEGYQTVTRLLSKGSVEGCAFCNMGNVVGWAVDYVTGSMFKIEPNTINVSLQKVAATSGDNEVIYAILMIVDEDGKQSTIAVEMTPLAN